MTSTLPRASLEPALSPDLVVHAPSYVDDEGDVVGAVFIRAMPRVGGAPEAEPSDLDGDGRTDVAVGVPGDEAWGVPGGGSVMVYFARDLW